MAKWTPWYARCRGKGRDELTWLAATAKGVIMRATGLWATLTLALGAAACSEDVDSTDVKTSGVYAEMSVVATGKGQSDVTADLRVGGANSNTHLDLKAADKLSATVGTTTKTLSQSGNVYKTTFDGDAADSKVTVAFTRGVEDTSAPNSSVTLPAPFTVAGIAGTVSRQVGFTATWAQSTDPMRWTLDGDCLFIKTDSISDAGQTVIGTSDFSVQSGKEQETCNATFCLERTRQGTIDPAFGEGGVISAVQRRCVAFLSAP
jgi:hypothetical protein